MSSCCGTKGPGESRPRTLGRIDAPWAQGTVSTPAGEVPRVSTVLGASDWLGTAMVRCGFGRARYRVPPGLYAAGCPTDRSPVLLSANYKLSFDAVRAALRGRDAWILVLDTKGINVWCAAGKGTFGTSEVVRSVAESGLGSVVKHRRLVAPQLGAPGIAAHDVQRATGFRVVYGPVRAEDLPAFLDARFRATPEMRRVRFGFTDRLRLVPVEIVTGLRYALPAAAAILALGGIGPRGYSVESLVSRGLPSAAVVLATFLATQVLGPLLLPWLPGRAFALKGAVLGLALAALGVAAGGLGSASADLAWIVLVPAMASFLLMSFTGASTFTSLSGVLREMRFAVPAQIAVAVVGLLLWLAGPFVSGGALR